MARMHPAEPPIKMIAGNPSTSKKGSYAELKVYNELKKLPDEFHVFWSVHYADGPDEIDFVILAVGYFPVVVEVKGGLLFWREIDGNEDALFVVGRNGCINQQKNPLKQAFGHFRGLLQHWRVLLSLDDKHLNAFFPDSFIAIMPDTPEALCDLEDHLDTELLNCAHDLIHKDNFPDLNTVVRNLMGTGGAAEHTRLTDEQFEWFLHYI